jgi:hypothetical protein
MPTTPFIGLSVLIHLIIIGFHKIVRFKEGPRTPYKPASILQLAFGYFIIFSTFSVILTSGFWLLSASVQEEHSTIYAVERATTLAMHELHFSTTVASAGAARGYGALGIMMLVPLMLAIPVYLMRRHKISRPSVTLSQGGYSAVQVSLLMSGIISVVISAGYIVLYLLLVK